LVGCLEEASLLGTGPGWMVREGLDRLPRGSGLGVPLYPFQARSSRKEKAQRAHLVSRPVVALQAEGPGSEPWDRARGRLVGLQWGLKGPRKVIKPVHNGTSHTAPFILFEVFFFCL